MIEIAELRKGDEGEWDRYVVHAPGSHFFLMSEWKNIIKKSYSHRPYYLLFRDEDDVRGVLPFILMRSRIYGNKLISLPYVPYGGIHTENPIYSKHFFDTLPEIREKFDVNYIEFRNLSQLSIEARIDTSYDTLILPIHPDQKFMWGMLRHSMRRYVKKALESELSFTNDKNNLNNFYTLYSMHMRDLGSPPHSYDFFNNIVLSFPENARIFTVNYDTIPVASIFLLFFGEKVIYGWGAADYHYSQLYPNYFLFWRTIQECCTENIKFFDFGRSMKNEGTFLFKTGWGATPHPLYYHYYPDGGNFMNTKKSNPKRILFSKIWKKMPLKLANLVGPGIRRNIP